MTPEQAVGYFIAHLWGGGRIEGADHIFVGARKQAEEYLVAAALLGAYTAKVSEPGRVRVRATWKGRTSSRNHYPYGRTRLDAFSFILRGDDERREAFVEAYHMHEWDDAGHFFASFLIETLNPLRVA